MVRHAPSAVQYDRMQERAKCNIDDKGDYDVHSVIEDASTLLEDSRVYRNLSCECAKKRNKLRKISDTLRVRYNPKERMYSLSAACWQEYSKLLKVLEKTLKLSTPVVLIPQNVTEPKESSTVLNMMNTIRKL
ncbi:hypothetical protein AVEN_123032-1 [Araneus ventricosus]|uniref:Uncharacterized protein n=1 Tax=Araneus ventricosus TaxID=182803 RepID=A0A4Y2KDQ7_ARAVE|nr:hypothetical protein AVEN_123032-1 [Araneus ventricosus]